MKYLLQMIVDESGWQNLTPEQMQPMIDEMERFNDKLRAAGVWVSGEPDEIDAGPAVLAPRESVATTRQKYCFR